MNSALAPSGATTLLQMRGAARHTGVKIIAPLVAPVLLWTLPLSSAAVPGDVERARSILSNGAQDRNPEVRREAALAIGLIGKRERATELVIPLLDDFDVQVRVAAIAAVTDLADRRAIPQLKKKLEDPVPEVAFAAAKALYAFKDPDGREALLAILEGEKSAKSNPIRSQFREMMRMFHTPKTAVLYAVRQGIGMVPVPGLGAGVGALESLLWNTDLSPRASAALMMAKDKDPETQRALVEALSDGDWSVRASAAQAIALRNDPALRSALTPKLSDDDRRVRYRAAAAYLRLVNLANRRPGKKTARG